MLRIGILSDSHGRIHPKVLEQLSACDIILHAGDFASEEEFFRIFRVGTLYAVRGNCDGAWAGKLPLYRTETFGKYRFFIVHRPEDLKRFQPDADFVIFGHTHRQEIRREGKCCFINPGSCQRKLKGSSTMVVLILDGESVQMETLYFE